MTGAALSTGGRDIRRPVAEHPADGRTEREAHPLHPRRREREADIVEMVPRDDRKSQRIRHPLRFVLPSVASPNIVSISCSNWSAGRTSQTRCASPSPAFQNLRAVPANGHAPARIRDDLLPTEAEADGPVEDQEPLLLVR